jgi:hypothetical protein
MNVRIPEYLRRRSGEKEGTEGWETEVSALKGLVRTSLRLVVNHIR